MLDYSIRIRCITGAKKSKILERNAIETFWRKFQSNRQTTVAKVRLNSITRNRDVRAFNVGPAKE